MKKAFVLLMLSFVGIQAYGFDTNPEKLKKEVRDYLANPDFIVEFECTTLDQVTSEKREKISPPLDILDLATQSAEPLEIMGGSVMRSFFGGSEKSMGMIAITFTANHLYISSVYWQRRVPDPKDPRGKLVEVGTCRQREF